MNDKNHGRDDRTNAELLRELHRAGKLPDTNKRIQQFMRDVYEREISIQQIAQVLSRYCDRPILRSEEIDNLARRFLASCKNDVGLCKRILNRYKGLPCTT
jgi:hypothetical protein